MEILSKRRIKDRIALLGRFRVVKTLGRDKKKSSAELLLSTN